MAAFSTQLDIINYGLQILRKPRIARLAEHSDAAKEMVFAYDKQREVELSTNLWRFATRRAALRAISTDTYLWTPAAYAAGTTYSVGSVVTYDGEWWQSKVASNTGNTPDIGTYWQHYFGPDTLEAYDATISYYAGELVSSAGSYYLSLVGSNEANTPPSAGNWLDVGGTVAALSIPYPIGSGPSAITSSQYSYRLPHGFMRFAPQDPKAGLGFGYVGSPAGHMPDDWVPEAGYFVTSDVGPIVIRFVADFVDVADMHPLFCRMLSASLAEHTAPQLAEPDVLRMILANARSVYRDARFRAGLQNAVEIGPITPELDSLVTCRY